MVVFGLMWFGGEALKWEDDLFFYRTGIALKWWEKGVGKQL